MQMPMASNNNEARNDMAYLPIQKIYFSIKTALLQVHTDLFSLCR